MPKAYVHYPTFHEGDYSCRNCLKISRYQGYGETPAFCSDCTRLHYICVKCVECNTNFEYAGKDCEPPRTTCDSCAQGQAAESFGIIMTESLPNYKDGKPVPRSRLNMIKSRALHPDGNGEVVLRSRSGKITDRLASDY